MYGRNRNLHNNFTQYLSRMHKQDSIDLTTQTKPIWHRIPQKPIFMKYLAAKKLYSCECGYSRKLSFQAIQNHAKKLHNVLIDKSPNNYIVEISKGIQNYIYSLNPRPRILFPDKPTKQVQKSSAKITKLRRTFQSYRQQLKAYNMMFDMQVLTHFRRYIRNIAPKITDDPEVSDDPTTYFNDFIMTAPFLNDRPQEEGKQTDQKDLLMRYTQSLRRFWVYLKRKQKTTLELELSQDFINFVKYEDE